MTNKIRNPSNNYSIDRVQFLKELQLREVIRRVITLSEQKQKTLMTEDDKLRKLINILITEAETDTTPHASTAINFLEDLLIKILPGIEQDYKSLTTKKEQRDSFRAQLVATVDTGLDTAGVNTAGADAEAAEAEGFIEIEEAEGDIQIGITDDEKFIDIEGEETVEEPEETGIEANDTGSKLAAQAYDAIEKQITETFNTLSDQEDQKTFKDYLITNLKLYFDKWEQELGDVVEPTTPEYEDEKEEQESEETGEELGGDELGGDEEELGGEEELDLEL